MPGIDGPLEILLFAFLFLVIPIVLIAVGIKRFPRRSKGRVALFAIGILGLLFLPLVLFYEFVLVPHLHFPYPNHDYVPEGQSEITNTYSFTGTIQQLSQSCTDNEPGPTGDVSLECNLIFHVEILTDDNGIFFFDTTTLPKPAPNVLLNAEALVGEPVEIVQEKTPETYLTPSGELLNVWKVQSWQLIPRD